LGRLKYKSSFGADSVFGKLRELDGKIMVIGLPCNDSMPLFHHVEELEGCDYRYAKEFAGMVTDEAGRTYEDTFVMLVRDLDRCVSGVSGTYKTNLPQELGDVAMKLPREAFGVSERMLDQMRRSPSSCTRSRGWTASLR
jgi:hypothetical protein